MDSLYLNMLQNSQFCVFLTIHLCVRIYCSHHHIVWPIILRWYFSVQFHFICKKGQHLFMFGRLQFHIWYKIFMHTQSHNHSFCDICYQGRNNSQKLFDIFCDYWRKCDFFTSLKHKLNNEKTKPSNFHIREEVTNFTLFGLSIFKSLFCILSSLTR